MAARKYPSKDSQRAKVYAAERRAFAGNVKATEPLTEKEVREFAEKARLWLDAKHNLYAPKIDFRFSNGGRGGAWARRGWGSTLMFTPSAKKRWIVLHEVAHLYAPHRHPDYDGDDRAHGWVFCDLYLMLVQHYLGVEAAKRLRAEFRAEGARYRPKRTMSPEQRAAAAERLAKARAAKAAAAA
jgi:hypothetical protein